MALLVTTLPVRAKSAAVEVRAREQAHAISFLHAERVTRAVVIRFAGHAADAAGEVAWIDVAARVAVAIAHARFSYYLVDASRVSRAPHIRRPHPPKAKVGSK